MQTRAQIIQLVQNARRTAVTSAEAAENSVAALPYTFNASTVDADPGAGIFRLNNATPASATAIYIDNIDADGVDMAALLNTWDDSTNTVKGILSLRGAADSAIKYEFTVTGSVTDGPGYKKVTLTYVSGAGALAGLCFFTFERTGDKGIDGTSSSLSGTWRFDTSTVMADPSTGDIRLNAATFAAVTQTAISQTTQPGVDATNYLATLSTGDLLYIQDKNDATKYARYEIDSTPVDNGAWWTLVLVYINGGGTLPANNNDCILTFVPQSAVVPVQELTASGAVTAGIQSLELNHIATPIAATIADAINHQGLFIVKDTSPSGIAAHTLTLTAGTFNGVATVATFIARDMALVVYFDSTGRGTIIANIGAVALA